ncbi:unnamed protein product [Cylindrotheca closterium]|uniref:Uncharacterized protein n=1 Tax=Cylindrotheca closterium TaxID=2856 RepID=A0AAD2FZJ5_9STRA|nr:unnamed protein product [Cylindrotheca closterium]
MNLLLSATALLVLSAFPSASAQRYQYRWEPSISPAPTETAIPSPSPSDVPTTTMAPTITGKPTVTASAPPTVTNKPTDSPTESPAPSPSPSDIPSGSPSAAPSSSPSSIPSSSPSFVPSDMPSLAPTHVPSAVPSVSPTNRPTVTPQPSIPPTEFPTITSKTQFAETDYILSDVPGALPAKQLVTFTTVAKEVLQSMVDKEESAKIDILYVEVLDQVFTPANGERRQLKKGDENGILQIALKVAAEISPGDFAGFPELLDFIVLSTETDKVMEEKLKRAKDFYGFTPAAVEGSGSGGKEDVTFSNGALAGIALSCVAGVALLFYHGRKTHYRVLTRKRGSYDRSGEGILAGSNDDYSADAYGKNSYIPKDWDASSPQSVGDDGSKLTSFSTEAVMGGKPSSKRSFNPKKMFRRSGKQSPTQANEAILDDLEKNFSDSIQITHTTSDMVSRSSTGRSGMGRREPSAASDAAMMPPVMEDESGHSRGTLRSNNTLEEMTAIETILENPSDEQTRGH